MRSIRLSPITPSQRNALCLERVVLGLTHCRIWMMGFWLLALAVHGADIEIMIRDANSGSSEVMVMPGAELSFEVLAELTDSDTQGLALIVMDLVSDGGVFESTQAPTQPPMSQFTPQLGFSQNPEGYGGTLHGTWIEQIGGAQNVFSHGAWSCTENDDCPDPSTCTGAVCTPIAGLPTGTLLTDVGQPGNPVTIISGTWTAPEDSGTYTIGLGQFRATAVSLTTTGDPFWITEDVPLTTPVDLAVIVRGAAAEIPTLSQTGLAVLVLCLIIAAVIMGRKRQLGRT